MIRYLLLNINIKLVVALIIIIITKEMNKILKNSNVFISKGELNTRV